MTGKRIRLVTISPFALLVVLAVCVVCPAQRIAIPEGFPDADSTGCSGTLTPSSGITVTVAGTVIENMQITGGVQIKANNVTIRNCRIIGGLYGVNASFGYTGTLIEDCTIYNGTSKGIYGGNFTARRCDISMYSDCMLVQSNVLIEDCWLHDLKITDGSHNDGVQSTGGRNVTIRHCSVQAQYQNQTSAFIFQTNNSVIDNVLFENNFLSGGTYTVYLRDKGTGYGAPTNVRLINNVFEKNSYAFGHLSTSGSGITYSGNIFHTGEAIPQNPPLGNQDPVADAGADRTVYDQNLDGLETLTLDGSGSSDSDGSIVSYAWYDGAALIGTTAQPTVTLSFGVHQIALIVTDNEGATDSDTVLVEVAIPSIIADAGDDLTATADPTTGLATVLLDGSGSFSSAGAITTAVWMNNALPVAMSLVQMVQLPVGIHEITLLVFDDASNQASDAMTVTVTSAATPGDANGDGAVDISDFVILKQHYGMPAGGPQQGDFNADGTVDIADFVILKQHYGS